MGKKSYWELRCFSAGLTPLWIIAGCIWCPEIIPLGLVLLLFVCWPHILMGFDKLFNKN